MTGGIWGRVLHVDLSTRSVRVLEPEQEIPGYYRRYWGGGCMAAQLMLKHSDARAGAFDAGNAIVFAAGPLTGAEVPGVAKYVVVSKSPLSGAIAESAGVGGWGAGLKKAGLDAVVVVGKSRTPVYLVLAEGAGKIEDATEMWGRTTSETTEILSAHQDATHVLCIGPAGENRVRYASIISDRYYTNLRGGLGAVMGAKGLKAVVANASLEPPAHDPSKLQDIARDFEEHFLDHPVNGAVHAMGMGAFYEPLNQGGFTTTLNGKTTSLEDVSAISGAKIQEELFDRRVSCSGCPGGCPRLAKADESTGASGSYRTPELELLMAIGNDCGIQDLDQVVAASERFSDYGIDYVSFGVTLATAMECFEKGYLTKDKTDGMQLRFGAADVLIPLIEKTARREGFGDLLAEGSLRLTQRVSPDATGVAMQCKGIELPLHDPRTKPMLALSYAVSPAGPDDLSVEHDSDYDMNAPQLFLDRSATLGILDRLETTDLGPQKVRMMRILEDAFSFMNSAGICKFAAVPCRYYTFSQLKSLAEAVTGWEVSLWELMRLGERRIALQKVFNGRAGLKPDGDTLPARAFEAIEGGPQDGVRIDPEQFEEAKALYYGMRGWDPRSGALTPAKLVELDIGDEAGI
ncbi:hypothetical protein JW848_06680 [Candidatus Bipolaricaulota bacterium]|nr:hypothetical protein [Candidatus Bipolaricaulota bacterium]